MFRSKKMRKIIVGLVLTFALVCAAVNAEAADGNYADVPGGEVSDVNGLYEALGGESTAVLGDEYVMLRYNVCLKEPIELLKGDYVLLGAGCSVRADFTEDFMITVCGGASLTIGSVGTHNEDDAVVFDGQGKTVDMGVLCAENGSTLKIYSGTAITDVVCEAGGGAICNDGMLYVYDAKITNCRGNGSGGAVFNRGEAVLSGGNITDCSAEYGGAVYNEGKLKLGGTQIENCVGSKGGALFNTGSTELVSSSLNSCSASKQGGAIYNSSELILSGGQISGAASDIAGGAVYNTGKCTLGGTFITECRSADGGGVYNCGTLEITGGIIERCSASGRGGDVYNAEDAGMVYGGGSIYGGEALYGGGIFNAGTLDVEGGGFSLNKAKCGEAILNDGTLNFQKYPYVDSANDVMVIVDETGSHAVNICSELKADKVARLTPGIKTGDGYAVEYSDGAVMIAGERISEEYGRFTTEDSDRPSWYVSKDGTLKKKLPVYRKFWFYAVIIVIYVLVIFAAVNIILYFRRKRETAVKA